MAIIWLKKATENIDNPIPDAWLLLGDIMNYNLIDEKDKAKECYQRAKEGFIIYKKDPEKEDYAIKRINDIKERLDKIHSTQDRKNISHKTNLSNNSRRPHDKGTPSRSGESPRTHKKR